ncbi:MAG: hypothetical protein AA931_03580 [Peptococcaceae bacterium 1109]|jgi:ribosome biogenesis GTPase|nr:MAG: hypothetical protein AA931_03580 [Peptococcaceae bacterium 1109]
MEKGIIIQGMGGFYEVLTEGQDTITCRLRGRLRLEGERVLVGDRVKVSRTNAQEGVVEEILPRTTFLPRPPIANVEQVLVVMAAANPDPDLILLDRILVHAELAGLEAVVVINKCDADPAGAQALQELYRKTGYPVILASAKSGTGLGEIQEKLAGRVSTLAGPSGVGKSSLINALEPGYALKTGDISDKLGRGRHTTRSVSLLPLSSGGLIADTPGFSRLDMAEGEPEELQHLFPEFAAYVDDCQFRSCRHRDEPRCGVKEAAAVGKIAPSRYSHYLIFLNEIEANQRY